tara:strand:+ start:1376 stop:1642 length:267 start_codon:yes stop_codon:yes gene_type:complete
MKYYQIKLSFLNPDRLGAILADSLTYYVKAKDNFTATIVATEHSIRHECSRTRNRIRECDTIETSSSNGQAAGEWLTSSGWINEPFNE